MSAPVRKAFAKFVKSQQGGVRSFMGKITAYDASDNTCTVEPLDGNPEYFKCRLNAADSDEIGFVVEPKIGTLAVCLELGDENDVFVVYVEEFNSLKITAVERGKIYINGDRFSMVKAETLQQEVEKLNAKMKALEQAINTWMPTGALTDAGALKIAMSAALSPLPTADFSGIKNETVKHG